MNHMIVYKLLGGENRVEGVDKKVMRNHDPTIRSMAKVTRQILCLKLGRFHLGQMKFAALEVKAELSLVSRIATSLREWVWIKVLTWFSFSSL